MAITDRIKRKPKAKTALTDFGTQGHPLDRSHPFYFGFVATLGALVAIVLMRALASTSQIFVLIIVALFLATGLNPAVVAIQKRGISRTKCRSHYIYFSYHICDLLYRCRYSTCCFSRHTAN
jgi:hypothetical protein